MKDKKFWIESSGKAPGELTVEASNAPVEPSTKKKLGAAALDSGIGDLPNTGSAKRPRTHEDDPPQTPTPAKKTTAPALPASNPPGNAPAQPPKPLPLREQARKTGGITPTPESRLPHVLAIQSAPITLREKSLVAQISGLEAYLRKGLQTVHFRARSTAEFTGNALVATENAVKASFSSALFSQNEQMTKVKPNDIITAIDISGNAGR